MRRPALFESLMQRLIVLPAVLVTLAGILVLFWSVVSWMWSSGRLVAAVPDAVLGLVMTCGGFLIALVFGKLSTPKSGMPEPRTDPSRDVGGDRSRPR